MRYPNFSPIKKYTLLALKPLQSLALKIVEDYFLHLTYILILMKDASMKALQGCVSKPFCFGHQQTAAMGNAVLP